MLDKIVIANRGFQCFRFRNIRLGETEIIESLQHSKARFLQRNLIIGTHIVNADNCMAFAGQLSCNMKTDESSRSRYDCFHFALSDFPCPQAVAWFFAASSGMDARAVVPRSAQIMATVKAKIASVASCPNMIPNMPVIR